jgi:hypothetical protein
MDMAGRDLIIFICVTGFGMVTAAILCGRFVIKRNTNLLRRYVLVLEKNKLQCGMIKGLLNAHDKDYTKNEEWLTVYRIIMGIAEGGIKKSQRSMCLLFDKLVPKQYKLFVHVATVCRECAKGGGEGCYFFGGTDLVDVMESLKQEKENAQEE